MPSGDRLAGPRRGVVGRRWRRRDRIDPCEAPRSCCSACGLTVVGPLLLPGADRTNAGSPAAPADCRDRRSIWRSRPSALADPWVLLDGRSCSGCPLGMAAGGSARRRLRDRGCARRAVPRRPCSDLVGDDEPAAPVRARSAARRTADAACSSSVLPMVGHAAGALRPGASPRQLPIDASTAERTPTRGGRARPTAFCPLPSELYARRVHAAAERVPDGLGSSAHSRLAGLIVHAVALLAFVGRVLESPACDDGGRASGRRAPRAWADRRSWLPVAPRRSPSHSYDWRFARRAAARSCSRRSCSFRLRSSSTARTAAGFHFPRRPAAADYRPRHRCFARSSALLVDPSAWR